MAESSGLRGRMKLASDILKIVTHEDLELAKRAQARAVEANRDQDSDPAHLMDVLGNLDELKREIHERMRRIEAVKQAKSLLLEDAVRTEALNRRLAEIGKVMSAVHSRDSMPEPEPRHGHARLTIESTALPWPKQTDMATTSADFPETSPDVHEQDLQVLGGGFAENQTPQKGSAKPVVVRAATPETAAAVPVTPKAEEEMHAVSPVAAGAQSPSATDDTISPAIAEPQSIESQIVESQSFESRIAESQVAGAEIPQSQAALETDTSSIEAQREVSSPEPSRLPEDAIAEARGLLEQSAANLQAAIGKEEQAAADYLAAQQALAAATESASERLHEAEVSWKDAWTRAEETGLEAKRLFEESAGRLDLAAQKEEHAAGQWQTAQEAIARVTEHFNHVNGRLEEAERSWNEAAQKAEEVSREAGLLVERTSSELHLAVQREAQAEAQLKATREALLIAYTQMNDRLTSAIDGWKHTEQIALDAKRQFEEASGLLDRAVAREEQTQLEFQSVQKTLISAYESTTQRMEEAERHWKQGDLAGAEARQLLEKSIAELGRARSLEMTATSDLHSARQELTTAYQFASVAAQRRLDASVFFQSATRWAISATAFSWTGTAWAIAFALRNTIPIWSGAIATAVIAAMALFCLRLSKRQLGAYD